MLNNLYDLLIQLIKETQELSRKFDLLNSQEFLDFQDNLNELSIDPEQ